MNYHVNRADIEQYVRDTLPWDELSDWDTDAIVDDMITAWPTLIGWHDREADLHLGPNRIVEHTIDNTRYWAMVERHQRIDTPTTNDTDTSVGR